MDLSDGPWSKGCHVYKAVSASSARTVVVADADVWCDGVLRAVQRVQDGAPWAAPHAQGNVRRLSADGTVRVYAGEGWGQDLEEEHRPVPGGGIVVIPRESYLRCPIDPRFLGWGQEDESWYRAMGSLLGAPWFGEEDLHHLWHPPAPRLDRRRGSREGWMLMHRYRRAAYDRPSMEVLVKEALDDLQSHQSTVYHPSSDGDR